MPFFYTIVQCIWQPLFVQADSCKQFRQQQAIMMAMLPVDLPETFIVTDEGLPCACFGEQQHDTGVRYVEQFGMYEAFSLHCPTCTEPQPARLWRMTCGRKACALCYPFNRARNAVRKLRANTIHYYNVMRQAARTYGAVRKCARLA